MSDQYIICPAFRPLPDPDVQAEMMGSGKHKCKRCRPIKKRKEVSLHG